LNGPSLRLPLKAEEVGAVVLDDRLVTGHISRNQSSVTSRQMTAPTDD
jgi:hypothetical protein